jgi:hypothetical protein
MDLLPLWHSSERASGYGAPALEPGFGLFQFFNHSNLKPRQAPQHPGVTLRYDRSAA